MTTRTRPRVAACAIAAIAVALAAGACADRTPRIANAWVAATPPGAVTAAAYMEIAGAQSDRLLGARSDASRAAELHTHLERDGVVRMSPVESFAIEPGAPVVLAPGGNHIMLVDLTRSLAPGDVVGMTLRFERAGERTLELPVRDLRTLAAGHGSHAP
jgi:copper(I)-binding protein